MADNLLDKYRNNLGEVALVPSQGGAFEVLVGEEKLHSKLETGRFPDAGMIVKAIGAKLT